MRLLFPGILLLLFSVRLAAQSLPDSLFTGTFNGVVVLGEKGRVSFIQVRGCSDCGRNVPLRRDAQFVIGSLSKQITAVLVLREYDKGRLRPEDPVSRYLSGISWGDSVTIHQLLNHTSGAVATDKPLTHRPGTKFVYSPTFTYGLLARIIEKTSGKSYDDLAADLFVRCGMKHSTTPARYSGQRLSQPCLRYPDGHYQAEKLDLQSFRPLAAGGAVISTAEDLLRWNTHLHGGKLLSADAYRKMTTPSSERDHTIWGKVGYGYGIQIGQKGDLGHSGYLDAYNSINFYYPSTGKSLILLSNVDASPDDIIRCFALHRQLYNLIR